ncbi:MAG: hypothetical protein CL878_12225 [Dehalococcoidia bacterium]|nr:hypothetical protein [Dehalococcoidia bacterium]
MTTTEAPVGEPAVTPADPDTERDLDRDALLRLIPPFKVIVWDNDFNTFEEVIRILLKAVPGMTVDRAVELTNEIHESGSAVPYVGPKEQAEAVAATIATIGIKVTVEPE